jgi:hypothetical protein
MWRCWIKFCSRPLFVFGHTHTAFILIIVKFITPLKLSLKKGRYINLSGRPCWPAIGWEARRRHYNISWLDRARSLGTRPPRVNSSNCTSLYQSFHIWSTSCNLSSEVDRHTAKHTRCDNLILRMAAACHWGVESGKLMYSSMFGHVPTCVYMSHRQNESVQDSASVFLRSQWDSPLWIHCTRTDSESTVLFGSADKVTGICSEEKSQTLAWQVDSPPWLTPVHDVLRVREFLAKKSITKIDHPPYSPVSGSGTIVSWSS